MTAATARPEPDETLPTGTEVAVVEKNKVMRFLDSPEAKSRITPMLGNNGRYEQIKVEVWCAVQMNPEIAQCTPASQVHAIAAAVGTGLIIGKGVHLVPFNTKVSKRGEPDAWEKRLQAILDYKGKVELIVRTGTARALYAKCVYANEVFEYEEGLEQKLRHIPITDPTKRGALRGAYAIARLSFNNVLTMFVPIDEIEAIRAKSKQWARVHECPYWYAEKTVLHRMSKGLPATPRLALALRDLRTDDDEAELAFAEPYPEQLPPVATRSIDTALPPRGTQLPPGGYEYEAVDEQRAPGVPTRVGTKTTVDPAVLASARGQSDPYGDAPHPADVPTAPIEDHDQADFSFDDDEDMLGGSSTGDHFAGDEDAADDSRVEPQAVACPKCGGPTWDNRDSKTKPNQPDYKCRNAPKARGGPGCLGAVWPAREDQS